MILSQNKQRSPPLPIDSYLKEGPSACQSRDIHTVSPELILRDITAGELYKKQFEELFQPVQGLICEGLTLFVGASKIGKSWAVLDMCLSVASGLPFLGRKTVQGDVLYFALEDSERRLQTRIQKIGKPITDALRISTTAQMVDRGFAEQLDIWMQEHPSTRLIVVDTFQKIRGVVPGRANAYQQDYQVMSTLKVFADKHRIALVLVHHLNKMRQVEDVYERISGSNGLMGAADTIILIDRERGSDKATVHFTGRDVWGDDFVIRLNDGRWSIDTYDSIINTEEHAYNEQPIVQLIRAIVRDFPNGTRMTYSDFMSEGYKRIGVSVAIDGRDLTRKLMGLVPLLKKYDRITLELGIRVKESKGLKLTITSALSDHHMIQVPMDTESST